MKKLILNNKKFEWLFQLSLLILFLYFIFHYAISANGNEFKNLFLAQVAQLEFFYGNHPELAAALLLIAHLFVSFFSIPACAFINIGAGYLFGFWKGTGLIYFITMISAVLGYSAGQILYNSAGRKWLWKKIPDTFKTIEDRGIIYLILLRLSPFLPFGLLNLSMGYSKISFNTYFISTFVGVFFDVVLLNKIGDGIRSLKETGWDDYFAIVSLFIILLLIVLLITSKKIARAYHEN